MTKLNTLSDNKFENRFVKTDEFEQAAEWIKDDLDYNDSGIWSYVGAGSAITESQIKQVLYSYIQLQLGCPKLSVLNLAENNGGSTPQLRLFGAVVSLSNQTPTTTDAILKALYKGTMNGGITSTSTLNPRNAKVTERYQLVEEPGELEKFIDSGLELGKNFMRASNSVVRGVGGAVEGAGGLIGTVGEQSNWLIPATIGTVAMAGIGLVYLAFRNPSKISAARGAFK